MRMNKLVTQTMLFENFTSLSSSPVSLCTKPCIFHGNKYSRFSKKAQAVCFHQPISVIDSNARHLKYTYSREFKIKSITVFLRELDSDATQSSLSEA